LLISPEERRGHLLRELRARVKAAWAVVATTPGLAETLARGWRRAARFYARQRITEVVFRKGVLGETSVDYGCHFDHAPRFQDDFVEVRE
jgi:hypothetical protein